jgi:nitroimidazol reductase NimA-like FMN-containing flavoprotein (pyridoxamine 5'-phosphate oxidase superfamily)
MITLPKSDVGLNMPKLSQQERLKFLNERGVILRLAVTRHNGSPLVTPIWYLYKQDSIYFTPRQRSEWFECLRADSRAALCIDEASLPYRKVLIEGTADLVHDVGHDDAWRDTYREIAERYLPKEGAEEYIRNTINEPRGLYRIALTSANVRSWRMPLEEEKGEGIWHQRYYQDPDINFSE